MAFWSGETLRQNINNLIDNPNLSNIVGAAYTLRIGSEIYVTPHFEQSDPSSVTKRRLAEKECFTIPAGQFGFLLTEEFLTLPHNLIGFISIRATIKFKGLVNVSGFHVDPGFEGRLIFSVFNAGPAPVHLQRGDDIFLLWISPLDENAKEEDARDEPEQTEIPVSLINNIPGEIHSLQSLSKMISNLDERLSDRIHKIDISVTGFRREFAIYGFILVGIIFFLLRGPIIDDLRRLYQSGSSEGSAVVETMATNKDGQEPK